MASQVLETARNREQAELDKLAASQLANTPQ